MMPVPQITKSNLNGPAGVSTEISPFSIPTLRQAAPVWIAKFGKARQRRSVSGGGGWLIEVT